jgi:hypothetical protein
VFPNYFPLSLLVMVSVGECVWWPERLLKKVSESRMTLQ